MNKKQKITLLSTAVIIAIMLVFPPYEVLNYNKVIIKSGYAFILNLPPYICPDDIVYASIKCSTLLTQIIGVLIIGGLIYFAFKEQEFKQ